MKQTKKRIIIAIAILSSNQILSMMYGTNATLWLYYSIVSTIAIFALLFYYSLVESKE